MFHAAVIGFVRYYISLAFSRKTANINAKKLSFYKKRVRPIIDTYKTAKISSVTSRAVDIIKKMCIISTAFDVTEGIFAVLYVSIMGLTRFYKTTVFTFIVIL